MKYIGAHVSAAGGLYHAPENAHNIGAKAFALFTKSQRQWKAKPLTEDDILRFKEAMTTYGYEPHQVLPHDSYLINLGNADPEKRQKSLDSFIHELERVSMLGLDRLNFHPGAHLKVIEPAECITLIAESLNEAIQRVPDIKLVIETTAGQGSALGRSFEEIASIIDQVEKKDRVGVCIDTCHIFAAGYDIRTRESYDRTMADFESTIGFDKLMGVHLNDAKSTFNSHVDRHHSIGKGNIGIDTFSFIMKDDRFDNMPIVLETIDAEIWDEEIKLLYELENK